MTTRRLLGVLLALLLGVTTAAQAAPFAYVTASFTNSVAVIDLATNTRVATVSVGSSPFGVAVNPGGTRAYVANWGSDTVSVIDTSTRTVVATVAVQDGPYGLARHPAGPRAYLAPPFSHPAPAIAT